jgi:predicted nuclease with TOPRIM domain
MWVLRAQMHDIRVELGELHTGQQELRTGLQELRTEQQELRTGLQELRTEQQEVRAGLTGVQAAVVEVGRHMRVLHEDTIARIAALASDLAPTRR